MKFVYGVRSNDAKLIISIYTVTLEILSQVSNAVC